MTVRLALPEDRERIYAIRHQVYARELGQHPERSDGRLHDPLDAVNVYVLAIVGGELAGFVSITPPNAVGYSIDKYFARTEVPLPFDDALFEVRLLTVVDGRRRTRIAALLMYAAWRWIAAQGGRTIVGIGRLEVLEMYRRIGFRPTGHRARSGAVTYELMTGDVRDGAATIAPFADALERHVDWRIPELAFRPPATCYHGGAFFDAIGDELDDLSAKDGVINADVLDAWFAPSPEVITAVREHLPWALRTSPPTGCEGMQRVIARARGVDPQHILPGAGSSDLIFLALRQWVHRESRVLILDPMYGEYAHILEQVIGCRVDRLSLSRARRYAVEVAALAAALERRYDWVILVNPNSPTGQHVPRCDLEALLAGAPRSTRFWIDETYVDYAGPDQSLEPFAARSRNTVICKSMSKVYALSGARAAYLCGPAHLVDELRSIAPPWAVSLPGQIAACAALRSESYYHDRWTETHALRDVLAARLRELGWDVVPAVANFLLCHLPPSFPEASALVAACRERKLFLRDVSNMGRCFDARTVRVAVKDSATTTAMLRILREALEALARVPSVQPAA